MARSRRRSRSGRKRPLNAFFKKMLSAKRRDADEFEYKGKTYEKKMTRPRKSRNGLKLDPVVYYKRKRSGGRSRSRSPRKSPKKSRKRTRRRTRRR